MKRVAKYEVNGLIFESEEKALKYIESSQYNIAKLIGEKLAYTSSIQIARTLMEDSELRREIKHFLDKESDKYLENE